MPQGSVLGPILFLIYINDLPDSIQSTVLLFADDTKLYNLLDSENSAKQLQNDLYLLTDWAEKWQMRFNHDKCCFFSSIVYFEPTSISLLFFSFETHFMLMACLYIYFFVTNFIFIHPFFLGFFYIIFIHSFFTFKFPSFMSAHLPLTLSILFFTGLISYYHTYIEKILCLKNLF